MQISTRAAEDKFITRRVIYQCHCIMMADYRTIGVWVQLRIWGHTVNRGAPASLREPMGQATTPLTSQTATMSADMAGKSDVLIATILLSMNKDAEQLMMMGFTQEQIRKAQAYSQANSMDIFDALQLSPTPKPQPTPNSYSSQSFLQPCKTFVENDY